MVETRAVHQPVDGRDTLGYGPAALPKRDGVRVVEVNDFTPLIKRGGDETLAAEDAVRTEPVVEDLQVPHAVEERQNYGAGANRRREGCNGSGPAVGLRPEH